MAKAPKPQSPDKPITVGGRPLTIRFSLRAMLALRDKWGYEDDEPGTPNARTGDQKVLERLDNLGMKDFVTVLWAATRTHHPDLTEETLIDMMDEGGIDGLKATLDSVILASAPPDAKKKPGPPTAAAKSTR